MEPMMMLKPVRDVEDYPVRKAKLPEIKTTKLMSMPRHHPVPVKTTKLPASELSKTHFAYGMVPLIKTAAPGIHAPYLG